MTPERRGFITKEGKTVSHEFAWKYAWDMFNTQVFDYSSDIDRLTGWLKERNVDVRSILEMGCGAGRYLSLLREGGYSCTGVDNDESILRYASLLNSGLDIEFIFSDILQDPPLEVRNKFDLVMAKHLSFPELDLEKVLNYARLALRDEGPKFIVFDFLLGDVDSLPRNMFSVDTLEDGMEVARLNNMELTMGLKRYAWQEVYLMQDALGNFGMKTNRRNLWFTDKVFVEQLLHKLGVSVVCTTSEESGLEGLSGLTIYGNLRN